MLKKKIISFLVKYRLATYFILAILLLISFFQIFNLFLAKGKEHDLIEFEFQVPEMKEGDNISAIACGDIDGDKKDEIIAMKSSRNPEIIYLDEEGKIVDSFLINKRNRNIDFNLAAGDIDGNDKEEVFIVPEENNSFVKIFKDNKIYYEFDAFRNAKIGASVASGDINYDGREEIIVGAGKGGGPQVKIYDFKGEELGSFFAFNPSLRSGINVASGNFDRDKEEEIFTSQKKGGQGIAKIYKFNKELSLFDTIYFYPQNISSGAKISTGKIDNDDKVEILVTKDIAKGGADLKVVDYKKNFLKLDSELLTNLEGNIDLNVCDFKEKKAVVLHTLDDSSKIKLIYKY